MPQLIERPEEAIYLPMGPGMIGNSRFLGRIIIPSQFSEFKGTFIKKVVLATPSSVEDDRYMHDARRPCRVYRL